MKCTGLKPVKVKSYCRKATKSTKKAKPLPPIPTKAQQKKSRASKAKLHSIAKKYLPAIDKVQKERADEASLEKRIRQAERKVKVASERALKAEMKDKVRQLVSTHKKNPNDPRIPRMQAGLVTLVRK